MKNVFLKRALDKAYASLSSKGRLIVLASQLALKAKTSGNSLSEIKNDLFLMTRLIKNYATGQYRSIEIKSIALILAAVIYFINPLDLIPDAIIGLGLTDDFTILTGVLSLVSHEFTKYKKWETNYIAE